MNTSHWFKISKNLSSFKKNKQEGKKKKNTEKHKLTSNWDGIDDVQNMRVPEKYDNGEEVISRVRLLRDNSDLSL